MHANDHWFRGINLKTGPDGGVFLIDWYDKNACHRTNPTIWDRTNGRVFKLSYGDGERKSVNLAALPDEELVKLHLHKNEWYVRTARRILQERQETTEKRDEVLAGLLNIVNKNADTSRRLRALWTLHALGGLDEATALALLNDRQEYVRAWTVQLVCEDSSGKKPVEQFGRMSREDKSPVVRLYLASALQRLEMKDRWPIAEGLSSHAEDAQDLNLPLMLWYGMEPLAVDDPSKALQIAEKSPLPNLMRFTARRAVRDEKARDALLAALAEEENTQTQLIYLEELAAAAKSLGKLKMPEAWPAAYEKLIASPNKTVGEHAQLITAKFGDKRIFPILRKIAADKKIPVPRREQAIDALLT
ncbi:MAG: dehydrogenase, partial [Planctomycetota bacterium]|nr:dehydrogenase [Planctomycetota bacterium]